MEYADLHIHSYYSDGTKSPEFILNEAIKNHISVLSITDHNVLDGSKELMNLAKGKEITCISGVELDADEEGVNYHILAYGYNPDDKKFNTLVRRNRALLEEVNIKLIEKMESDYDNISLVDYYTFNHNRELGGWKALQYFVYKGLTKNLLDGLSIYAKYNHTNASVSFPTIKEICCWIHDAGGIAVLAHPGKVIMEKNMVEFSERLKEIVDMGIDGLECYYPSHNSEVLLACLTICKENDLVITSGSDFHGDFQFTQIGQCKTECQFVNILKALNN